MRRIVLLLVAVFVVGAFGAAPVFADSTRLCNNRCAADNDVTTTNNIDNSVDNSVEDNSTTNIDNSVEDNSTTNIDNSVVNDNDVTNNTTNNTTNNVENCTPTQTGNNNTVNCFR